MFNILSCLRRMVPAIFQNISHTPEWRVWGKQRKHIETKINYSDLKYTWFVRIFLLIDDQFVALVSLSAVVVVVVVDVNRKFSCEQWDFDMQFDALDDEEHMRCTCTPHIQHSCADALYCFVWHWKILSREIDWETPCVAAMGHNLHISLRAQFVSTNEPTYVVQTYIVQCCMITDRSLLTDAVCFVCFSFIWSILRWTTNVFYFTSTWIRAT